MILHASKDYGINGFPLPALAFRHPQLFRFLIVAANIHAKGDDHN